MFVSNFIFLYSQNIEDVNDNAPRFPTREIELEFPENSKTRDVKRTLPPAIDLDRGKLSYYYHYHYFGWSFVKKKHINKNNFIQLFFSLHIKQFLAHKPIVLYREMLEMHFV